MPEAIVTALSSGITVTNLWNQLEPVIPIVCGIAIFAFGYRVLNRVLRKASRGRAGV